jgi:hypothetical protein
VEKEQEIVATLDAATNSAVDMDNSKIINPSRLHIKLLELTCQLVS